MEYQKKITELNLKIKDSLVQSVKNIARIFPTISTSTTITKQEWCGVCSAIIATSFESGAMIIKAHCNCLST